MECTVYDALYPYLLQQGHYVVFILAWIELRTLESQSFFGCLCGVVGLQCHATADLTLT